MVLYGIFAVGMQFSASTDTRSVAVSRHVFMSAAPWVMSGLGDHHAYYARLAVHVYSLTNLGAFLYNAYTQVLVLSLALLQWQATKLRNHFYLMISNA